jgi:hypothetical protein
VAVCRQAVKQPAGGRAHEVGETPAEQSPAPVSQSFQERRVRDPQRVRRRGAVAAAVVDLLRVCSASEAQPTSTETLGQRVYGAGWIGWATFARTQSATAWPCT